MKNGYRFIISAFLLVGFCFSTIPLSFNSQANTGIDADTYSHFVEEDFTMGNEYNEFAYFNSVDFNFIDAIPTATLTTELSFNGNSNFYTQGRMMRDSEDTFWMYSTDNSGNLGFLKSKSSAKFTTQQVNNETGHNIRDIGYDFDYFCNYYENNTYYLLMGDYNTLNITMVSGYNATGLGNKTTILNTNNSQYGDFFPLNMYKINQTYYLFTSNYSFPLNTITVFHSNTLNFTYENSFNLHNHSVNYNTEGQWWGIQLFVDNDVNKTMHIVTSKQYLSTFNMTVFKLNDWENNKTQNLTLIHYFQNTRYLNPTIIPIGNAIVYYWYDWLQKDMWSFHYLQYNSSYWYDKSIVYKTYPKFVRELSNHESVDKSVLVNSYFSFNYEQYYYYSDGTTNLNMLYDITYRTYYPSNADHSNFYFQYEHLDYNADDGWDKEILKLKFYQSYDIQFGVNYIILNSSFYGFFNEQWLEISNSGYDFDEFVERNEFIAQLGHFIKFKRATFDVIRFGENQSAQLSVYQNPSAFDNPTLWILSKTNWEQRIGFIAIAGGLILTIREDYRKYGLMLTILGFSLVAGAGILSLFI